MKERHFEGKDRMLYDWGRVMIAIIRSVNGGSNIEYKRDEDGKVIGLFAELEVQLEEATTDKDFASYDSAVEEAKKQMEDLIVKNDEFTSKQRLLIDWVSMRNSIVIAHTGEMKVGIHRNKHHGDKVVGLSAELDLNFYGPTEPVFTTDEKAIIDKIQDENN